MCVCVCVCVTVSCVCRRTRKLSLSLSLSLSYTHTHVLYIGGGDLCDAVFRLLSERDRVSAPRQPTPLPSPYHLPSLPYPNAAPSISSVILCACMCERALCVCTHTNTHTHTHTLAHSHSHTHIHKRRQCSQYTQNGSDGQMRRQKKFKVQGIGYTYRI